MKRSAEERLLHERLSDVADASPDRVALTDGSRRATFAEVWAMSGDIAARLLTAGLRPGEIVALAIPRSIEIVAAAFGVLRAGGVVFGMDPHAPAPRSERLVAASGARRALVSGPTPPWLGHLEVIDLLRPHTTAGAPPDGRDIDPSAPAFLIFTSGSTGDPKGVLISHATAGRRADAERVLLSVDADTVYLYRTRTDLVGFLVTLAVQANGVPLVIVADQRDDDPRSVLAVIEAHGVTHAAIPPRLLREIIRRGDSSRGLRSLRRLRCSGEPLPEDLADAVLTALPECLVRDEYGATETAGVVAFRDVRQEGQPMSSGSSAGPGATLRVVDGAGADSEVGEVWVEGSLLALGYLGGDDEVRQRFVVSEREGEHHRAYRTGDQRRRQPDGTIRILGRMDLTLNVDGVRIDPVEIERVLREHPSVADAAVWAHPDLNGRLRLVAYLVDSASPGTTVALREHVSVRLPPALVPSRFVRVATLPLTSSGKIDRPALPAPVADRVPPEPAANDVERRLLELFRRVLDEPGVGVTGDFFEWGGDSLKAFALTSELNRAFGTSLSAATLLTAPTVRALGLLARPQTSAASLTVWMRKGGDRAPLICVPGLAGDPLWFQPVMARLDPRRPILGLSLAAVGQPFTITGAVAAAIAAIRDAQPTGPYLFVGHSVGGVIVFEVARALLASGERIAFIGLIDTYVPGATYAGPGGSAAALKHRFKRVRNQLARFYADQRNLVRRSVGARVDAPVSFAVPGLRSAAQAHRIEPADLPVTFFRAKERPDLADLSEAWRPLARGGVDVVEIAGGHFDLAGDGRAEALATAIADSVGRSVDE